MRPLRLRLFRLLAFAIRTCGRSLCRTVCRSCSFLCRFYSFRGFRSFCDFRGFCGLHYRCFALLGRSLGTRSRFTRRGSSFGAAFIEAVHRLIDLVDHLLADTRNFHQLFRRHSRKFLDGGDPRRFDLFDGLRAHTRERSQRRHGRSQLRHLFLDFLALFFLALDVNVPADELARQPDVLPLFANGQRKLRILHNHFQFFVLRIGDLHARHFRRAQRLLRERHCLFAIRNDVDLFAAQFANDRLHAHALHAHARTHGIHVLVPACHRHLGALTRFPRRKANLHRAVVYLRHFHFEQSLHQARVCARNNYLRPFRCAIHHLDHHAQPFADVVSLQLRLFALWQPRFRAPHVHDQIRAFGALYNHGHQLAHPRVILVENRVARGFAHFLQNHLFRRLRRNASQHVRWLRCQNLRPDLRSRILSLRLRQADFFLRVGHFFDDHVHREHVHLTRFLVEFRAQIFFRLVILPRRHHHRVFNRRHYHFRLDVLLAAQHLNLLVQQIRHIAFLEFRP